MCFIPDYKLHAWAVSGGVEPFEPETINPASIDLRWSGRYRYWDINQWSSIINSSEISISPGRFYLLDTIEYLKVPSDWVGMLMLKSSMGRQGLEHLHAGYFDPGFQGTATLELENRRGFGADPIIITAYQRIVQIAFSTMLDKPKVNYGITGRYNGQNAPQVAK
jgi:dCTP deaminase